MNGAAITTDESALLTAIRANPADDAPRLIYADLLEENGESGRAEFIRVQVELARNEVKCPSCGKPNLIPHRVTSTPWLTRCRDCNWSHGPFWSHTAEQIQMVKSLRRRELELLKANGNKWLPEVRDIAWIANNKVELSSGRVANVTFSRGFISHVTSTHNTIIGGECQRCSRGYSSATSNLVDDLFRGGVCPSCKNSRRTQGVLPQIVRAKCAAVGMVKASNKKPLKQFALNEKDWTYSWLGPFRDNSDESRLTNEIWELIPHVDYTSESEAITALSDALIQWAWSVDPETTNVDAAC